MRRTCSLLWEKRAGDAGERKSAWSLRNNFAEKLLVVVLLLEENVSLLLFVADQFCRLFLAHDLGVDHANSVFDGHDDRQFLGACLRADPGVRFHPTPVSAGVLRSDADTALANLVHRATCTGVYDEVGLSNIGSTLVRPVVRAGRGIDVGVLAGVASTVSRCAVATGIFDGTVTIADVAAGIATEEVEHQEGHRGHSQKKAGHVHSSSPNTFVLPKVRCPQQVFKEPFLGNAGAVYE